MAEALNGARHLRGKRVLCDRDGASITQKVVQVTVRRAARRANVRPGVHILRHTFRSHLAMRGAPARAIARSPFLGEAEDRVVDALSYADSRSEMGMNCGSVFEGDYAGVAGRLGALLCDAVLLIPLGVLAATQVSAYRTVALGVVVASTVGIAGLAFHSVYLVRRLDSTPGMWLCGLRIANCDGRRIGIRQALLRVLPVILFAVIGAAGTISWIGIDSTLPTRPILGLEVAIWPPMPPWLAALGTIQFLWVWSEPLVILTNRRRRALNDLLAGTVVVNSWAWRRLNTADVTRTPL
jgi:uncharacterized RDD family membrane protein YckC